VDVCYVKNRVFVWVREGGALGYGFSSVLYCPIALPAQVLLWRFYFFPFNPRDTGVFKLTARVMQTPWPVGNIQQYEEIIFPN
jgi:hypothetical protein